MADLSKLKRRSTLGVPPPARLKPATTCRLQEIVLPVPHPVPPVTERMAASDTLLGGAGAAAS